MVVLNAYKQEIRNEISQLESLLCNASDRFKTRADNIKEFMAFAICKSDVMKHIHRGTFECKSATNMLLTGNLNEPTILLTC